MKQTKSPSGIWHLAQRRWLGYVVAGVALGATIVARYALATVVAGQSLPLLFIIPIALAAYAGGLGPTIAVTFAGAAAEELLFVDRAAWGFADLSNEISILLFIGAGILLSVTSEAMHRARARAETVRRRLQGEVEAHSRTEGRVAQLL